MFKTKDGPAQWVEELINTANGFPTNDFHKWFVWGGTTICRGRGQAWPQQAQQNLSDDHLI